MTARWIFRGLLLVVLSFASLNDIWSPDVLPNALLSWTLLREDDVDYDEFATPVGEIDRTAYFFRACGASTAEAGAQLVAVRSRGGPPPPGPDDRVCSVFPPGAGLLALPVFVPFVLAEPVPSLSTLIRVGHLAAAITEALATLLLWSVLTRFVSARWALALILLYTLGTSVRTVSSQALWQHAAVHLAVSAALWLVLLETLVRRWRDLLAGLALGLGTFARQTTALAAIGMAGFDRRRMAFVLAGTVVGALPLLVWNQLAFGNALEQGYGPKPFETAPADIASGLYGLLLSPSRGLLIYMPYLAFALAALMLAWRRTGEVASRLRGLSLVWVATLLLYASYAEWWGGRVFGARFMDDLAPVLFAALAWGVGQGLLASRRVRVVFWVLAGWSLLLFNAAALVFDNERWDLHPVNVNDAPERLFEWSDPQWLAVLGDLPSGGVRAIAGALLSALAVALLLRLELRRASVRR